MQIPFIAIALLFESDQIQSRTYLPPPFVIWQLRSPASCLGRGRKSDTVELIDTIFLPRSIGDYQYLR
jgi:hypothetical protein